MGKFIDWYPAFGSDFSGFCSFRGLILLKCGYFTSVLYMVSLFYGYVDCESGFFLDQISSRYVIVAEIASLFLSFVLQLLLFILQIGLVSCQLFLHVIFHSSDSSFLNVESPCSFPFGNFLDLPFLNWLLPFSVNTQYHHNFEHDDFLLYWYFIGEHFSFISVKISEIPRSAHWIWYNVRLICWC